MQEAERIKAAQNGDREALVQLLRDVETPLYRTAYYMLGNEQDALDATQDALIKIYKSFHSFEHKAKFLTWAQRIVTNVCIDKCRKKKDAVSIDEHEFVLNQSGSSYVDDEMDRRMIAEDIQEAINQLPENHRAVVIMRYLQDLSYKEIAEAVDLPINTVKSHLFRARQQLQTLLQDLQKGGVSG
ncbi:RNA polymerase sigma factor [Bacillus horti]|uniref:RNA polymerase sigma-70 factor (ECF subfamily) n=1 Tax=Caldalkalibacillus horti TaxID=77523 RepID=A0ABT9VTB4_9BACI|nr:sigma-70 family RNA polymerase sigma factor [Bacillus horti]MDQ0164119.1 RNA polymerase sigma-70 factor (ECF subfamily) [Bacillus horti]